MIDKQQIKNEMLAFSSTAFAKAQELCTVATDRQHSIAAELESIVGAAYKLASENDAYDLLPDRICDLDQFMGHFDEEGQIETLFNAISKGLFDKGEDQELLGSEGN
jgi:hypothetical protein